MLPAGSRRRTGPAALLARLLVAGRWVVVPLTIGSILWLSVSRPPLDESAAGGLAEAIPSDLPAFEAQRDLLDHFPVPLLARQAVVQYDPDGLSAGAQAQTVLRAAQATAGELEGAEAIAGALPVVNVGPLAIGEAPAGTTMVTYVFFRPGVGTNARVDALDALVDRHLYEPEDGFIGVTGALPARAAQAELIAEALPLIELLSVVVVVIVMGWAFRSLGAPLLALGTIALAYLAATRIVPLAADVLGVGLTGELEPLMVALLVGLITDYTVFFLDRYRRALASQLQARHAAEVAAAEVIPLVAVAGLTVAVGVGVLTVSRVGFFGQLGPGLAIVVLVAMAVSIVFTPAAIALFGRRLLWPWGVGTPSQAVESEGPRGWRPGLLRLVTFRPVAFIVVPITLIGLGAAVQPLTTADMSVDVLGVLPADAPPREAAAVASRGFSPGVVAPTVILVEGDEVARRTEGLRRLERRIAAAPGVAGVIGPSDLPTTVDFGLLSATDHDAVRYVVLLDDDPSGAQAIDDVADLHSALPGWLDDLDIDARVAVAGDTALSASLVDLTLSDVLRVGVVILLLDLLLLVIFLRSLLAPLLVLSTSVLVVAAGLGLTEVLFGVFGRTESLVFYVPLSATVLLMSFSSDYNVYLIGRIWERAERWPLRDATVLAGATAGRAIAAAGVTLAASFSLLLLIPVDGMGQLAAAIVIGVLLDVFVVRPLLLPGLFAIFGSWTAWPNRRLREAARSMRRRTDRPA